VATCRRPWLSREQLDAIDVPGLLAKAQQLIAAPPTIIH
jgi:hypothetical protein